MRTPKEISMDGDDVLRDLRSSSLRRRAKKKDSGNSLVWSGH